MEEKRICPECGKEYSSRPALSRKDNKTMICPKCGMMEALDTVRNFYAPGTVSYTHLTLPTIA